MFGMFMHGAYYFFAGLVGIAAIGVLWTRHILYAALYLIVVSIGLSAIYFLQGATWIAITYLLVYANGILVMLLFALFMFKPLALPRSPMQLGYKLWTFLGLSLLLMPLWWQTIIWVSSQADTQEIGKNAIAISQIGYQLLGSNALLLELVGILLLISVIGALHIVKGKDRSNQ
jgi:NADH-quinone oxidoreductase subunit J